MANRARCHRNVRTQTIVIDARFLGFAMPLVRGHVIVWRCQVFEKCGPVQRPVTKPKLRGSQLHAERWMRKAIAAIYEQEGSLVQA